MTIAEPAAAAVDGLRVDRCPGCGYMLTGLPPAGACPECGRAYDEQLVVLYGWAAGSRGNALSGNRRAVIGFAALAAFNLFNIAVNRLLRPSAFWTVALLAWLALVVAVVWLRVRRSDMPGLVQVHLSPAGASQLDAPQGAPPPPMPWRDLDDGVIERVREDLWRIRFRHRSRRWPTPVDAEVRCTPAQADALRKRVSEWHAATAAVE